MSEIDWHRIYADPFDAEMCSGYYDGRRLESPEPSSNRHPAYVHGFINGRDDIGVKHGQTAEQRRQGLKMIRSMLEE